MDEQLKQLFDYTKFHIGMYTTLVAAIIGVFANSSLNTQYSNLIPFVKVTVILFGIAGAAGGLVASSIPFFTSFDAFSKAKLGPWSLQIIPSVWCMHVEHTAFWVGCLTIIAGLFYAL